MLSIIFIVISILVICFGFVLLYGAPYVPTLKKQVEDLAEKMRKLEDQIQRLQAEAETR